MKRAILLLSLLGGLGLMSCSGGDEAEKKEKPQATPKMSEEEKNAIVEDEIQTMELEELSTEIQQNEEELDSALSELDEL